MRKGLFLALLLILTLALVKVSADEVTIMFTSSINGEIEGCDCPTNPKPGFPRLSGFYRENKTDSTILLDTGDVAFNKTEPNKYEIGLTRLAFSMYEQLGYDLVAIGDQELSAGITNWKNAEGARLAINANIERKGEKLFPGYRVIERNDISVGFFSVLHPDILDYYPSSVKESLDITVRDPGDVIDETVTALRKIDVDLVVMVSHLGWDKDISMAKIHEGIDLIISGHDNIMRIDPVTIGKTVLVSTAPAGTLVGVLTVSRRTLLSPLFGEYKFSYRNMEPGYSDELTDQDILKQIEQYKKSVYKKRLDLTF
jgi:2',3'-cyclic-nucleotide 2'-phosphodiesterase (5'-nucleotidase family)